MQRLSDMRPVGLWLVLGDGVFCEDQLKVTSLYSVDRRVSLLHLNGVPEKLILLQG